MLAHPRWVVALLTLSSLALCLHGLTAQPLWNDEAFSFFVARRGLADTFVFIQQDSQPPLYYLTLSMLLKLGHGVFAVRVLSALAMVAAVPIMFDAARRLLGVGTALLAAGLLVITPECVGWAQIARPYALQTLLVAVSFWGFVRIWLEWRPPRPGRRTGAPVLAWAAYVLGGGLAVLAQYPAVFFLLACNAAIALRVLLAGRGGLRLAYAWMGGQLWLAVVWLPWLVAGVRQVLNNLTPAEIAARHTNYLIGIGDLLHNLAGRFEIDFLWRGRLVSLLLIGAIALFGLRRLARSPHHGLPVIAMVLVPPAACVAGYFLVHPVFGYVLYTFAWMQLGMVLLLAAGVLAIRPRALGVAALALLLLGNAWGLVNQEHTAHVPLDKVAGLLAADLRPGDGILLTRGAATRWGLAYYLGPPYADRLAGLNVAIEAVVGWPISTPAQALRQRRLWVVVPDREPLPFNPAVLTPAMTRQLHRKLATVLVERYDHVSR